MCFFLFVFIFWAAAVSEVDWQQENKELKDKVERTATCRLTHPPTHADTLPRIVIR